MKKNKNIAVVGAGAWGCALALHIHRTGARVQLWARNPSSRLPSGAMPQLQNYPLPADITVSDTLPETVDLTVVAVPVQHLASVSPLLPCAPVLLCCKGVEQNTLAFPLEILSRVRPDLQSAVLSGPNFAHGIAAGLPAATVIAAQELAFAQSIVDLISSSLFRFYTCTDYIGVQLGGAAKNVIAIAAGAVIGADLGENARAAIITRGLAEMGRLTSALGGQSATLSGLAGTGDLLLTCTSENSRNYQMGLALGRGSKKEDALTSLPGVAEGVTTACGLLSLARRHQVSVPITETISDFLSGTITLQQAKEKLLNRPFRAE